MADVSIFTKILTNFYFCMVILTKTATGRAITKLNARPRSAMPNLRYFDLFDCPQLPSTKNGRHIVSFDIKIYKNY